MSFVKWLIEYFSVIGLVIYLASVALSKIVIGAILSILGALLPQSTEHVPPSPGTATIQSNHFRFDFRGSARLALVLCGLVVLAGAAFEHYPQYASELALRRVTQSNSELGSRLQQRSQRCADAQKRANTSATPDLDVAYACRF
jgi:hypothetical protein